MNVKKDGFVEPSSSENAGSGAEISVSQACIINLACALALATGFFTARNFYSVTLVSNPSLTLLLILVIESPVVILTYSWFRQNPDKCSYFRAVGRGVLGLPFGALVNAFGAIALGSPVGTQYLPKTLNWSLLMSLFTCVPAASVFGSAWSEWQRLFAHTKPKGSLDYLICIPAHGAVIGAWFGAWPMPLDWERPWQEWPICVANGALIGYLVGMVVSVGFILVNGRRQHLKAD
ncbi:hypothetical protein HS088_TW12G00210 [Tripterygium wilfordii]|uniref:Phosphatidylinositol-glycan biosynthesis class F protein n=1 Tax=Tripterygium wilfordii TaxID=458696 RepID=A0A7J7CY69_TRIWF|nr:uncharacterized protein C1450.15 [Tripterygium wilfordii]KAF5739014.1 hypothetical protein HS088_TW12G00210 [Tripterygium wilfordii]